MSIQWALFSHVMRKWSVIICEKMPEISAEEDPLTWWRTHETTLPHLAQFAKKYPFISASSSASECVFSALPQAIFVHVKYTSLSCSRLVIFIFKWKKKKFTPLILWQFFLRGIENGIEYRYFSRYRIEVRNSSIVTTLLYTNII